MYMIVPPRRCKCTNVDQNDSADLASSLTAAVLVVSNDTFACLLSTDLDICNNSVIIKLKCPISRSLRLKLLDYIRLIRLCANVLSGMFICARTHYLVMLIAVFLNILTLDRRV